MTLVKEMLATHPAWILARFGDSPVDCFGKLRIGMRAVECMAVILQR